jgi:hypothetical protein
MLQSIQSIYGDSSDLASEGGARLMFVYELVPIIHPVDDLSTRWHLASICRTAFVDAVD